MIESHSPITSYLKHFLNTTAFIKTLKIKIETRNKPTFLVSILIFN